MDRRRRSYGGLVASSAVGPGERFAASLRLHEMSLPTTGDNTYATVRSPIVVTRKGKTGRLLFMNSYFAGNGTKTTPGTDLTIQKAALFRYGGSTTATPVNFSASRSSTITAGSYVWSDTLNASDFGVSQFEAGQIFWFHGGCSVAAGGVIPVGNTVTYSGAEGDAFFCLSTEANYLDQIDTAGNMTTPTAAVLASAFGAAGFDGDTPGPGVPANNMGWGPVAFVVDATDPTEFSGLAVGPSTLSGREDTRSPAPVMTGWGFLDRASQALGMAIQHATRSGATVSGLGGNADIDLLYRYADKLFLWVGNNGMQGGATAAEELANAQVVLDKFGKAETTVTLGMPRTTSTDSWVTDVNQTYDSAAAGATGKYVQFSRLLAAEGRAGRIKNVLPLMGVRSDNDLLRWDGVSPAMTPDGLHFTPEASVIAKDDVADVLGATYSAWPDAQRRFAMACVQRPPRTTADMVAAFQAATDAASVSLLFAHWLNTPVPGGDTGQIRRVDINGGFWPLSLNPSADASSDIDYSVYGTRSGDGVGYLRTFCLPATHFISGMTTDCSFIVDVEDSADQLSVFATRDTGSADRFVFTPYSQGNAVVRLNTGTNLNIPSLCKPGLYICTRSGNTVSLYRDGVLVGTGTSTGQQLSSLGISPFCQIGGSGITRRGIRFLAIATHALTEAQIAAMTSAVQTLTAWAKAQQVLTNWHPLADPYFEMIEELTGSAPTSDQQTWFNDDVVQALDTAGFLSLLDYVSLHHFIDARMGLLNFIRPRNRSTINGGTDASSIDFVAGSGSKFSTYPIVTDLGPNHGATFQIERGLYLQQNDGCLIWRGDVLGTTSPAVVGTNELAINPRNGSNQVSMRGMSATADAFTSSGGSLSGVHTVSLGRTGSTTFQPYLDGAADGAAISRTSAAFSSASPIHVGARSGSGGPGVDTVNRARWVLAGASLGSAGQAAIHAILAAADASMP